MLNCVTIVMYHYVRELPYTRYPRIKGLLASEFVQQLSFMQRHYTFVRIEDCLDAIYGGRLLPDNAALLTFDDGYIDHYTTVFPILAEREIQGAFFPPARAIAEHVVLDVNKIHFVLASAPSDDALLQHVLKMLDEIRPTYGFADNAELYRKFAHANRFDSAAVIFIKRLLQKGLDDAARSVIIDRLFASYVSDNEATFARELYLNADQLRLMSRAGMWIGSHGHNHAWMAELPAAQQMAEIDRSLEFLDYLSVPTMDWVMCYPYGSYSESLIQIIRARGCKLGLTSRVGVATLNAGNAFTLERLDTNDLPKLATASPVI